MFVKLMILILVIGSSGVGVLSVRQSRLQAAHETAEARLRIGKLENHTSELKAEIARYTSPTYLVGAIQAEDQSEDRFDQAVQHRATLTEQLLPSDETSEQNSTELWYLDDGTEVLILNEEGIDP